MDWITYDGEKKEKYCRGINMLKKGNSQFLNCTVSFQKRTTEIRNNQTTILHTREPNRDRKRYNFKNYSACSDYPLDNPLWEYTSTKDS